MSSLPVNKEQLTKALRDGIDAMDSPPKIYDVLLRLIAEFVPLGKKREGCVACVNRQKKRADDGVAGGAVRLDGRSRYDDTPKEVPSWEVVRMSSSCGPVTTNHTRSRSEFYDLFREPAFKPILSNASLLQIRQL